MCCFSCAAVRNDFLWARNKYVCGMHTYAIRMLCVVSEFSNLLDYILKAGFHLKLDVISAMSLTTT